MKNHAVKTIRSFAHKNIPSQSRCKNSDRTLFMPNIRVTSLEIDHIKFRKLGNLKIELAPRITIIAGHNGIGKSTLLALLAHPSGLTTRTPDETSYFDKTFQANFNEIIHLDYKQDYADKLGPPKTLAEPLVHYLINETEFTAKACRLGPRPGPAAAKQARVVARSVKPTTKKFTSIDGTITIGSDGKVPLPTIYLGMTRVLPVGEAHKGTASSVAEDIHPEDAKLIADFFNSVIPGGNASPTLITTQRIKKTGKISGQPTHGFDPRCVSLGQDSLGSIALALASFQKLQRTQQDYAGGLLIVDEIDSGLHPHAIGAMVKVLKTAAKRLQLQVVATTHSPMLIAAVHPESEPNNPDPSDKVIYIRDRANPTVMQAPTLQQIINDMSLIPPAPAPQPEDPKLKIYFEDDEAAEFFQKLIPLKKQRELGKKYGVKISPMPMGLGCEHLAKLAIHDEYFYNVVIVLDGDATLNRNNSKNSHIAQLPGDKYKATLVGNENTDIINKPLSPERTLLQFILNIVNFPDENQSALKRLAEKDITTDQLLAHMLDGKTTVLSKREQTKSWWQSRLLHIRNWGLIEEWAIDRENEVAKFHADVDKAVASVAARIKK